MSREIANKISTNTRRSKSRLDINRKILTANEIKNRVKKNECLANGAKPYVEKMYQLADDNNVIIILTDGEGCIISIETNKKQQKELAKNFIIPGSFPPPNTALFFAVDKVVTKHQEANTEQGNTLAKLTPSQWVCHSTPIETGANQLAGTLSVYFNNNKNAKMLNALLNQTASCIGHELLHSEEKQQVKRLKEMQQNILNKYTQSNIVVNSKGTIQLISDEACATIGIERDSVIGKNISKYIKNWENITYSNGKWIEVKHEEIYINNVNSNGYYLLTTKAIIQSKNKFNEQICTLQSMGQVLNEANKYIGNTACIRFNNLIAVSVAIKRLIKEAKAIAKNDNSVMLIGEKHTGREWIAQAIHNASARAPYGFVKIDASNLSSKNLEELLWGYSEDYKPHHNNVAKPGAFEFANGGTLYINNIGLMPVSIQEKVLNAIRTKKVTRLGSTLQTSVDVRIICSNPSDLSSKIEQKEFKIDLFYSLSTSSLRIPALRERRADIPVLMNYFTTQKAEELGLKAVTIPKQIILILRRYEWPGNIKEMIELSERIVKDKGKMFTSFKNERDFKRKHLYLDDLKEVENLISLEENEKMLILKAYSAYKGSISKTARKLGISRNTLYLKLKKYGVNIVQTKR